MFVCCICSCLLACVSRRLSPSRYARCALWCLLSPCCAALPSGVLPCRVAVFCAACRRVVSRLALLRAALRYALLFVPRSGLLLRTLPCLLSFCLAALFALWFAVWFCCALPCAVACRVLGCCAAPRCSAPCCAVVCCVDVFRWFGAAACCVMPSGAVRRPGVLCFPSLCLVVFPRAVCFVLCVFCCGLVVRVVVRCCALCCGCPGLSCCAFPVLPALCGAVLRCDGALALCRSCGPRCFRRRLPWCVAVCCAVACGVLWRVAGSGCPRVFSGVSVSLSLSGRLAWFPVVGVVCCRALLPCVVVCGAVLSYSPVFLPCCLCLVFLFSLKNHCKNRKNIFSPFCLFEIQ